jgi:hypothetical protein
MMLLYPEFRSASVRANLELSAEDFRTAFHRRVFEAVVALDETEGGFSLAALGEQFSSEETGRIVRLEQKRRELTNNDISVFRSGVERLKQESRRIADEEGGDFTAAIRRKREEAAKKRNS